jgi:hypothetical protein
MNGRKIGFNRHLVVMAGMWRQAGLADIRLKITPSPPTVCRPFSSAIEPVAFHALITSTGRPQSTIH